MDVEALREDFPALKREINGKPPVYLDNACMTLRPRQVIDALTEYYEKYPACHGRSVHKFAMEVTERFEKSRKTMQRFINASKSNEILFTKNTTEGINLIANALGLQKGDKVLTTDREHNSNLIPWLKLEKGRGIEHEVVPSNQDNTFNMENFESMLDPNVKVVSLVHTSNLDGYTIPAKEIIKKAHRNGSLVVLDGAQSAPHKEVDVKKLDADFFAFSCHKMCGPSGMGVLYGKQKLLNEIESFIVGGETVEDSHYDSFSLLPPPEKFEAGLQNYAGAMGAAAAAEYLMKVGKKGIQEHELKLNKLGTDLLAEIPKVSIIGPGDTELRSGIVNFLVEDMDPHDVSIILDETKNVMTRSGRHCVHSWYNAKGIRGSTRASMYFYNTEAEIELFANTLKEVVQLS